MYVLIKPSEMVSGCHRHIAEQHVILYVNVSYSVCEFPDVTWYWINISTSVENNPWSYLQEIPVQFVNISSRGMKHVFFTNASFASIDTNKEVRLSRMCLTTV